MLKICLIKTSVNSPEEAEKIATVLVENRLAACVQTSKGKSTYRWKTKIEVAGEHYLTIKTAPSLQKAVVAHLMQVHPYELPEITCAMIETTDEYGDWVHNEVNAQKAEGAKYD